MIESLVKSWEDNKKNIREQLRIELEKHFDSTYSTYIDYEEVIKILFSNLHVTTVKYGVEYNYKFNMDNMVVLDNGHYQGTLIYILPIDGYQPTVEDYFYTHNYYGSCSGCDLLLSIIPSSKEDIENKLDDFMKLCLHVVQRTKRMGSD